VPNNAPQLGRLNSMELNFDRVNGVETIELSRRPSTVSIVVTIMGALLVLQVGLVFATREVALPLMMLVSIAACSAGWLAILALESMLPVSVTMDKDGINISRMLGDVKFPWVDVTGAKIVHSGGMLSDDTKSAPSGRLAVGLFLKSRKTPRAHELDADFVIFGASAEHAELLLRLVERIADFKATIGSGLADPTRRIRKAAPIQQPAAFRRPRSAA
jgi:hypothetical protein